jgi:hypothetical protein
MFLLCSIAQEVAQEYVQGQELDSTFDAPVRAVDAPTVVEFEVRRNMSYGHHRTRRVLGEHGGRLYLKKIEQSENKI